MSLIKRNFLQAVYELEGFLKGIATKYPLSFKKMNFTMK
ncbi:hypothetical protein HPSA50_0506 [Helicobacter pylori SouthAfrica50]|uniref:Uncharacterized protein n=1 Tax=Helicobacter pylori SouthAfrica50 TaxID=1352357 RepID=T2SBW1_HELPX|nr:hypothetical protein HPSA50_0506 [Helicobacter pylori SouthAfrica50]